MGKTIAKNRKAFHDFEIIETYEAGISLQGTEVKSLREGRVNLKDSYGQFARLHLNNHGVVKTRAA
jgi:SsrA-binding protein